jgi:hypothetical protein
MPDLQTRALRFFAGCGTISTFSGGSGSVILLAVATHLIRLTQVAPVITVASLMASPARIALSWRLVEWRVVRWYLPGAVAGARRLAPELGVDRLAHPDRRGVPGLQCDAISSRRARALIPNAGPVLHSGLGRRRPGIRPSWRQQSDLSPVLSELRFDQGAVLC